MEEQLALFNSSQFNLINIEDRRTLNHKNYPASGWIQTYYKNKAGQTTTWQDVYGPYYQFCYKKGDKTIIKYVSKTKQKMVLRMIGEGRRAEEIAKYLSRKLK